MYASYSFGVITMLGLDPGDTGLSMPVMHPIPRLCRQMMKEVANEFGGVDILVNNVGIQFVSPVHELPDDKWDAIIAVCLSSTFHATKAALPYMLERKWGRIINTGALHREIVIPLYLVLGAPS